MTKITLMDNGNHVGLIINERLVTVFRDRDIDKAKQWVNSNISNTKIIVVKGDYRKLY